jgi:hypothetical protein
MTERLPRKMGILWYWDIRAIGLVWLQNITKYFKKHYLATLPYLRNVIMVFKSMDRELCPKSQHEF